MTDITIVPATPDRFPDVEHAMTGGGDGASCWCQWWTLTSAEWKRTTRDGRRERAGRSYRAASGLGHGRADAGRVAPGRA